MMRTILILFAAGWIFLNIVVPLLIPVTIILVVVYFFLIEPFLAPASLDEQEKLITEHLKSCREVLEKNPDDMHLIQAKCEALSNKLQLAKRVVSFLEKQASDQGDDKSFKFPSNDNEYCMRHVATNPGTKRAFVEITEVATGKTLYLNSEKDFFQGNFWEPEIFISDEWLLGLVQILRPFEEEERKREKEERDALKKEEKQKEIEELSEKFR